VSERTQKDTELVDGNIYDRRMSEGASPAGFSASLGNSVNEERSCARKPNNIVVNASRNRLARKPYAGNPHVRFEEGEGSSRTLSTLLQILIFFGPDEGQRRWTIVQICRKFPARMESLPRRGLALGCRRHFIQSVEGW